MTSQEIREAFERLGIHENDYPAYRDAQKFAFRFERCSAVEFRETVYSDASRAGLRKEDQLLTQCGQE